MSDGVVITGMGAITPLANEMEDLWRALAAGEPAFCIDGAGHAVGSVDAEGTGYERFIARKQRKLVVPVTAMGIAAAGRAIAESAIAAADLEARAVGIMGATSVRQSGGGIASDLHRLRRLAPGGPVEKRLWEAMTTLSDPMDLLRFMVSAAGDHVSVANGFRGAVCTFLGGPSAGFAALREAVRRVARGEQRAMVVVATDSAVDGWRRVAYRSAGREVLDGSDASACRPYDAASLGFVPAEGAAALVVEAEGAARRRGAAIHARFVSAALRAGSDTEPGESLGRSMRAAMAGAGLHPDDVPLVMGRGDGSPRADRAELDALDDCFGGRAPRVVTVKEVIGYAGAAAGLIDAVVAARLLAKGWWRQPADETRARVLVNAGGEGPEVGSVILESGACTSARTW